MISPMPRSGRIDIGGHVYHVINRANGRMQIFDTDEDYEPNMKKMRKMLDQNAGEYTPEHMPSSCGQ